MTNKILIIGGTGNIGIELVKLFKNSEEDFQLLARTEARQKEFSDQNLRSIMGEVGDWPSIDNALADIDTVFLLTSPSPLMLDEHKGVIDRAIKAGVKKIVRLSAEPADANCDMPLYAAHGQADDYLQNSGIDYAILRPHYFMQNIATMHGGFIKDKQMFAQYLGDATIPMIDVEDIALAAFNVLTSDKHNNKTFILAGPQSISFADVATALSNSLGKQIQYVSLSYDEQKAGFEAAQLPEWVVKSIMTLFSNWEAKGINPVNSDIELLIGKKPHDINRFADQVAATM